MGMTVSLTHCEHLRLHLLKALRLWDSRADLRIPSVPQLRLHMELRAGGRCDGAASLPRLSLSSSSVSHSIPAGSEVGRAALGVALGP